MCLVENTGKYKTFTVAMENEVTRIRKKLEELEEITKIDITDYNLLLVKDLWQVYYQIFSIIYLKKLIKLNVNMDTMIKIIKLAGLSKILQLPSCIKKLKRWFNRTKMFML